MHTMLLALACLLAGATAAPATYDQRQDGGFNVRADVQNVVFVVAYPTKMVLPLLNGLTKSSNDGRGAELQDRADVRVLEAFVEPSEPYHVEIGESGRTADGVSASDARAVEVVIAGRRRLDSEPQPEAEQDEPKQDEPKQDEPKQDEPKQDEPKQDEPKQDGPKLLGATEEPAQPQPKPEEKPQIAPADNPSPEVIPVPS